MKVVISTVVYICVIFGVCMEQKILGQNETLQKQILFQDDFGYQNGLITNDYAYRHPEDPLAKRSNNWEMTSGSLFAQDHVGWTGVPDGGNAERLSLKASNSA